MNFKTCLLILYALSFVKLISSYTLPTTDDTYKQDPATVCHNGYCGINSYTYLKEVYRGLFHSGKDLSTLDRVSNKALNNPEYADGLENPELQPYADDGSICCSTHIQHKINTTLTNVNGESMSIIHLTSQADPNYQYIPHASCVRTGSCPGECVIENKILSLLAMNSSNSLLFGFFEIPGYCACKNFRK
ncbi:uncharacterized protein LOC132718694 [Ruditapes philippinarum]|uniref:uncharacterized protein LOC132718694 n=1 Tax=Ruditapes philippinarum TaxID=129788 RepID=UPI00295B0D8C|nr:uncharacterized protein LOC132718694 [Ruditapes philippinarum]